MALKLTQTFAGWKQCRCVHCGALYRYRFAGSAAVVALTPERRYAKMQATLDRLVAAAVEMRACPQCGHYQPEMTARQRRLWTGWTLFAVWMGVFWLAAITVNGQLTVPTLTLAAIGYMAACAGTLAWSAWRNPNADLSRNQRTSAAAVTAGTMRLDEPGAADAAPASPSADAGRRPGWVFAVLLALAVGLPTLAEGTRRTAGWPLNPAFFPPVVGPGDATTFYLPDTIRCVHGYWRGQAQARLLNAAELGAGGDSLPATTNDFRWAKELAVNPAQPDNDMHPWVTFVVPGDAALAGRVARVGLRLHTVFPELVGEETFVTGERDLAAEVSLRLGPPAAGRTYRWLWYAALVGSGVLLTLAARLLWKSSRREGQGAQAAVRSLEVQ